MQAVDKSPNKLYSVDSVIQHPLYNNTYYHDVALVKLKEKVIINRPACLWTTDSINDTTAIATGYGVTEFCNSMFFYHLLIISV